MSGLRKNKTKKGFTLVELLAVFVILAVLAMLVIPLVSKLIKQARINAAVVSAYGYVVAANNEIVAQTTKGVFVDEKMYEIVDFDVVDGVLNVKYEGRGPVTGWFNVGRSKVSNGEFCINGYDIKYEDGRARYDGESDLCSNNSTVVETLVCQATQNDSVYNSTTDFGISTVDDLICLADAVNAGKTFKGKRVVLNNDIDFDSNSAYKDTSIKNGITSGDGFTPIGTKQHPYEGSFYGNKKTVSNLYINRPYTDYVGLFGVIFGHGSNISDLTVVDSNVTGHNAVGTVVGAIGGSTTQNNLLVKNSEVNGNYNLGGVIGSFETSFFDSTDVASNYNQFNKYIAKERNINSNVFSYGYGYGTASATGSSTESGGGYNGNYPATSTGSGSGYNGNYPATSTGSGTGYNGNTPFTSSGTGSNQGGSATDNCYYEYYNNSGTGSGSGSGSGSGTGEARLICPNYFLINPSNTVSNITSDNVKVHGNAYIGGYVGAIILGDLTYDSNGVKNLADRYNVNNSLSNINIKNVDLQSNSGFVGGVIGIDSSKVSYRNINVNGSTIKSYGSYTGGIAGKVMYSSLPVEYNSLNSNTILSSSNFTGGMFGIIYGTSTFLDNSLSGNTITGYDYTGGMIGSIKPSAYNADYYDSILFKASISSNNIISGSNYVGGIIGEAQLLASSNTEFYSKNTVSGNNYVGGVFGRLASNTSYSYQSVGHIYSDSDVSGNNYVGGISGYTDRNTLSGIVAGGTISGNGEYVGYVAGYYTSSVDDLFRTKEVSVNRYTDSYVMSYGDSSGVHDGELLDQTYELILVYSNLFDTVYDGDNDQDGYFLDYEGPNTKKMVMYKTSQYNVDTLTIRGNGTQSNPYILATESDFRDATLLSKGGYYFTIANDIDLSTFNHFYPLGSGYFNGHIDGNNKTISNMKLVNCKYNTGFIPAAQNSTTISNFTLSGSNIKGYETDRYNNIIYNVGTLSGGFVFSKTNSNPLNNVNIVNSNINSPSGLSVGGAIGKLNSNKWSLYVIRTYDYGYHDITDTFDDSAPTFNINVDLSNNSIMGKTSVGGVFGTAGYNLELGGNINLSNTLVNGNSIVGGLIGSLNEDSYGGNDWVNRHFDDVYINYNSLNLNGLNVYSRKDTSASKIGGLIGELYNTNLHFNNDYTISGITVSGANNSNTLSQCGGIIGYVDNHEVYPIRIKQFENIRTSNISVSCTEDVGGIIGHGNTVSLKGISVEDASVTGTTNVGGMIGQLKLDSDLFYNISPFNSLYLNGSVTGTTNVGGVIGRAFNNNYDDYTILSITNLLADGANITGNNNVALFAGKVTRDDVTSYDESYIRNAYFRGAMLSGSITSNTSGGAVTTNGRYYDGSQEIGVNKTMVYVGTNVNTSLVNGTNDSYAINSVFNGRVYSNTGNPENIGMLDDVLDTYIGEDSDGDGYIFDYVNNNLKLVKVNNDTFVTHLSGSGTSENPYILATERDFKEATIKLNGGYYFSIANDIDLSTFTHFYTLGSYKNPFNGYINGNNHTISNLKLNGGYYGGFIPYFNGGYLKNVNFSNSIIHALDTEYSSNDYLSYTGAISGMTGEGTLIEGVNFNTLTIDSYDKTSLVNQGKRGGAIGGVVAYDYGTILGVNVNGLTINQNHTTDTTYRPYTGGIAYHVDRNGSITETTVRGTINGSLSLGGIAVSSTGIINHVLLNLNLNDNFVDTNNVNPSRTRSYLANNNSCDSTHNVYGVMEGGSIKYNYSGTASTSETVSNTPLYAGSVNSSSTCSSEPPKTYGRYAADILTYTQSKTITYSSNQSFPAANRGDLAYYSTMVVSPTNVNAIVIDSPTTGDTDNNGWWFDTVNGQIVAVRVTGGSNIPATIAEKVGESVGTCTDGDVTPPTCTFTTFGAVSNGISAQFSCTDETSVPTIASMFNSTTKQAYTYAQILDPSRGGTEKTGSVSGNTRTVNSTWTTNYDGPKPEPGKCYYYQFAAKDACGNESDWVTTYCARGFSNN